MPRPLVIFGVGLKAEQADFYFRHYAQRQVVAFTVEAAHLREDRFADRPVVPFHEAAQRFPARDHDLFVAIGHTATDARARIVLQAQDLGYTLTSFVHPRAMVEANVQVGPNTLVHELAAVGPFVRLGFDVIIGAQAVISHHTRLGAHSFIAPGAVICGDVDIGERCFVGANATVRDRLVIGAGCVIGAGAVVMSDCAPNGVYRPQPTALTRTR